MKHLYLILTGLGGAVMGVGIASEEVLVVTAGAFIAVAGFLTLIVQEN